MLDSWITRVSAKFVNCIGYMSGLVQLIKYIRLPITLEYSTSETLSALFLEKCRVTSPSVRAVPKLSLSNFQRILST